jgi:hypothetical protein
MPLRFALSREARNSIIKPRMNPITIEIGGKPGIGEWGVMSARATFASNSKIDKSIEMMCNFLILIP